jgi:hypothetical protein
MLRYDCCYPLNTEEAIALQDAIKAGPRETWSVTLTTDLRHAPTVGRWNSFLVNVEHHPSL